MTDLTNSLAVMNFAGSVLVFLCLYTIITAFYGNKLIEYFQLEKKYPKLAKVIYYRIKFQNYTIIYNFILLSIVLFIQTAINFLVLFGPR